MLKIEGDPASLLASSFSHQLSECRYHPKTDTALCLPADEKRQCNWCFQQLNCALAHKAALGPAAATADSFVRASTGREGGGLDRMQQELAGKYEQAAGHMTEAGAVQEGHVDGYAFLCACSACLPACPIMWRFAWLVCDISCLPACGLPLPGHVRPACPSLPHPTCLTCRL